MASGVIKRLQARGRGIVIKIEGDGASAQKALEMVREQLQATADKAAESGGAISTVMDRVKSSMETVGLYMGLREAVDGLKELTVGSLEYGEAMLRAHERTGLAVETLSTMHYAAAITGGDFDGLVNGLGRMNRTIADAADGNKKAATFMKSLGLNAKDLAGRTDGAEIAFQKFLKVLASTETSSRRTELAVGLLSKAGSAQVPVLLELAQHWDEIKSRAEAAGVVLTEDTAKSLADTSQRMKDLEQHIQGAGLALTEGLAPALRQMFAVVGEGKENFSALSSFGEFVGASLNFAAAAAFSLASGMEQIYAVSLGGRFTEFGRDALATAEAWNQKALGFREAMVEGNKKGVDPFLSGGAIGGGTAFGGNGDDTGGGKAKSDDPILKAAAALAAERAKAAADARKAVDEQQLAELEAQHKMMLVDDQEFFAERLRRQNDALDAEIEALQSKGATLAALYDKQHGDKTLHRDKGGRSAEELNTQREMSEVQSLIAQLEARRGQNSSAATADQSASNRAAELAGLKLAAELEKQRNDGITAQIALKRREAELEAQSVTNKGGSPEDAAAARAVGELEVKKLQIEQVSQRINQIEADSKRAVEAVNDAAAKDPRLKKDAADTINKMNALEAQQLKALVAQYTALAQQLGGPLLENAKNLQAELDKLNRPDNKESSQFGKQLADGIGSIGEKLANQAMTGKNAFHNMAQSIEKDLADLAIKMMEKKWLEPLIEGKGSGGGDSIPTVPDFMYEAHADGGTMNGPSLVGERGPELWSPPAKGGNVTTAETLNKLAENGGGGKGISVTQNLINQSSQPVQAQAPQMGYDSDLKQFVITTVLEDHARGGPISALGSAGG